MKRKWILGTYAAALAVYAYKLFGVVRGLRKLKSGANAHEYIFSVIVPARNEEASIRRCLESLNAQDYPTYLMEILVVDDRSSDRTAQIVHEMRLRNPRIRLVTVDAVPPGISPKKHAITVGVEHALGTIIATTDADCTHRPGWIAGLNRMFEPEVGIVVGHTVYREPRNWFEGIQAVDYLAYRVVGTGVIGEGGVLNATGSNLAYRKSVFEEVGGFGESGALVSGDDDLFIHRVKTRTNWRIAAATSPETFVTTDPATSLRQFFAQRARWASKIPAYRPSALMLLVPAFLVLIGTAILLPLAILSPRRWAAFWPLYAAKIGIDRAVMGEGARKLGQEKTLRWFWIAGLLFPYYVVAAVLTGIFGKFAWKGTSFARRAGAPESNGAGAVVHPMESGA